MIWLIIFYTVTAYLIYSYYKSATFWKRREVPSIWPWPIVGNIEGIIFRLRSQAHVSQDWYMTFPGKRYAGVYNATIPFLLIRDPDLIKKTMIKEFDTFPERRDFLPDGIDPMWSKNLFAMKGGKKWQDIRSTLSPSFTSNKMKMMFNLIKECSTNFGAHFCKTGQTVTVELKDAFTKFSNDVIATTAFGVTCNSLENPKNEFYFHGLNITSFKGFRGLKFFFYMILPKTMKLLGIPIFPKVSTNFFTNVIGSAIKLRKEKAIVRLDMIHLLMEANKGNVMANDLNEDDSGFAVVKESSRFKQRSKSLLSDEDIVAQAMIFFFAGFDTASTMMSHAVYELALNPEIQEKLRKELEDTLDKFNGETTYEAIIGMKYLDMVLSETLRKWPPVPFNNRRAVRPFVIEPERPGEKHLHLNAGDICIIPVYGIHRDPLNFPNPDKFDPERFSDDNKHNIKPFTFLPFGAGPRNCIGSRFALLEGKLILFEIIRKFEIIPVEKTKIPLELGTSQFAPIPDEGFWVGLKPRCEN